MRFLTRLLKTPEEDQNEDEDEFAAEENGLLMVPSLPGDREGASLAGTPEADAAQAKVPAAEGELANPPSQGEARPAEDEAGQLVAGEGESPDLTKETRPPQSETQETVAEGAQTEQPSPDDPMNMFRGTAKRTHMAPVLKDNLEDVSAVDLLTVARSIRNDLLGRQAAGVENPQKQERAA
jgi:hypothetical protein